MISLHSLLENLTDGIDLHSQNFFTVDGKASDKQTYLDTKEANKTADTPIEIKQTTKYTTDFKTTDGVNRFGKPCKVTTASKDAKWLKSNEVESLTIQSKPATAAKIGYNADLDKYPSQTIRWIVADLSPRQIAEIKTIRFKLALTKELDFGIDSLDRIKKLKANPNCKPNSDNADLQSTLDNDSTNFINKLADIMSEVSNILNGTEVKPDANIF